MEDIFNPAELVLVTQTPIAFRTNDDMQFDQAIFVVEQAMTDPSFVHLCNEFFMQNCNEFEDQDENKLEYTLIHKAYVELVETFLEHKLRGAGITMSEFMDLLPDRVAELSASALDKLVALTDFLTFKEMMLKYRYDEEELDAELELALHNFESGKEVPDDNTGHEMGDARKTISKLRQKRFAELFNTRTSE
eukprot:TRINITY_DN2860_c0_g1_i1.p2 TRINITY_DN2860_c0_g1~~TRINITY_DN2860_c0_g1_i1.p2  ORF type:complete len:192 (-),score=37.39 TRINITY_DN2860_c0_g1_i1:123-698(-)